MPYPYPRTVAEFATRGRFVVVRCGPCSHQRFVAPDVLEAAFGPDFDCYAGMAELRSQLRCDRCGERNRVIDFVTLLKGHGEVSFDESVAHALEFNALIRARDGNESTATRGPRRRR
ncbi:MAG: hypothetical protein ABL866_12790 [Devosia sp.]